MTRKGVPSWREFILAYGYGAYAYEVAAAIGRPEEDVARVRSTGACTPLEERKRFPELFTLWHGRAPEESDWPLPRLGGNGGYEWQPPELAVLASLVGVVGVKEIARVLTERLRKVTGNRTATRTPTSVQVQINRIGLQSTYVRLSSIREEMAIRSDKLSEFARLGYIPTARRCTPYGTKGPSTQFGTWFVDGKVAEQLVADRRAGRPMPWHGKPLLDNLRITFRLWQKRQHPATCETCATIWGPKGAPNSFGEYVERYPPLAHGAKRHLTRPWEPGLTIAEVAKHAGCAPSRVRRAISSGVLEARREGRKQYVTKTEATRWKARKCPAGESERSWLSLDTAGKQYLFSKRELRSLIADGVLKAKVGTNGPMRGVTYVLKHQCRRLREEKGFTEDEAAKRVGVSVKQLQALLEGVDWRGAQGIPLATVQAAIKRLQSQAGYTIDEAAREVNETPQWVRERIADGTVKVLRVKWEPRRVYLSEPMVKRLREAKYRPRRSPALGEDWLLASEAAVEAGVSTGTINNWAMADELPGKVRNGKWHYHREAVRARARKYWAIVRRHRAVPPAWFQMEQEQRA